jgi:hypothetical protein
MPTYNFENTETGEITEEIMKISDRDIYLSENPQLKGIMLSAPGTVKATGDRTKTPNGFKEVLSKISEANPTSSLAGDYGHKDHKSVTTRNIVQKHREKAGGSLTQ